MSEIFIYCVLSLLFSKFYGYPCFAKFALFWSCMVEIGRVLWVAPSWSHSPFRCFPLCLLSRYNRVAANIEQHIYWDSKFLAPVACFAELVETDLKSDNLQYNTVGRWVDGTIVPPSDGTMFILIDWELFSETVAQWLWLTTKEIVERRRGKPISE